MKTKLLTNILSILLCLVLGSAFVLADSGLSIEPQDTNVEIGDSFTISVDIDTDESVGGVQLYLNFNPSIVEVDSYVLGGFLDSDGGLLTDLTIFDNAAGDVEVAIFKNDLNGVTGTGSIINITFNTLSIGESNLTLSKVGVWDESVVKTDISGIANGTATVASTADSIVITEIMKDPSMVSDTDGEYIELYNPNSYKVDMDGWKIKDEGTNLHEIDNGSALTIEADGYLVLCLNDNSSENGGFDCDYEYSSFSLGNDDDEVILLNDYDIEVDRVVYDDSDFPDTPGASMELIDPSLDNNNGSNWVEAKVPYGLGDKGTPGIENSQNSPPDMPVLNLPLNGALLNTDDVTLNFTINDVDNDLMWCYIYGDNETNPNTLVYTKIDVTNGDVTHEWTNLDDGVYYWKVQCDDGVHDSLNSTVFSFTVDAAAPLIKDLNKTPEPSYNDNVVTLTANVTDEDLDKVWLSYKLDGQNWTNQSTIGIYNIYGYAIFDYLLENQDTVLYKWYANDTAGNIAETAVQSFTVENRDPILTLNITVPAWDEDTNTTFDISSFFTDLDGDNLTYDVEVLLQHMGGELNETSGEVFIIPNSDFFGNDTIVFSAMDAYGGIAFSNEVVLTVNNTNDAPYFTSTPSLTATEAIEYTYDANAYDIDSNVSQLVFSAVNVPLGVNINDKTGVLTWTSSLNQVGTNLFEIEVEDPEGEPTLQEFNITVLPVLDIVDITVEGVSVEDGEAVYGIAPGDILDISYDLFNRFPSQPNKAIVGITTDTVIDNIDIDSKTGINLEGQATRTVSFQYQVPYSTGEESLLVEITADGDDLYDVYHSAEKYFNLSIDRDFHRIAITDKEFSNDNLTCARNTVLSVELANTGNWSESGTVTIYNAATGTNLTQSFLMNKADESQLNFDIDASQAAGNEVFDITVKYRSNYYTIEDSIELLINGCLDVEALNALLKVNESEAPNWSPIDLKDYTYGETTGLTYGPITEGNATLIDCDVNSNGIFSCGTPAADLYGISTINISVGDVYEQFNVEVIPRNDAPVAYDVLDNTDEDTAIEVTLNYTDADNDNAVSCNVGNLVGGSITNNCNCVSGVCTVELTPTANSNADITADYNVSDGLATSNTATITVSVNPVLDAPSISGFSPEDYSHRIGDGVVLPLSVNITNPDSIGYVIKWETEGVEEGSGETFDFSKTEEESYQIIAKLKNLVENETYDLHRWSAFVSLTPVTTTYSGTINDVTVYDVNNFTGLTIYNQYSKIDFGNQTINLSDVVDVDTNVRLQRGVAGIDTSAFGFDVFKYLPATITIYGLSFTETPTIYYNGGFSATGTSVCDFCSNVQYNTTTGTLVFEVDAFSTYFVIINEPPVITSSARTDAVVREAYSYDVDATDPESNTLTYSLTTKPSGMTIDSSSGVISWTPNATGTYDVAARVTDGDNSATQSYQITVREKNMLIIDDLDVKVDGKKDSNLEDGDTLDDAAKPGDKIEFEIKVKNDYDDNIDIEDIQVRVTIDNIGDDDLEDEANEFDLSDGKSETITLSLTVPEEAEEDTYEIVLEVEGSDEDGNDQGETWYLTLDVERDTHDVKIKEVSVSPSTIRCSRSISLPVELVNIGSKDEDVDLTIRSSALGIDKIDAFSLDKDPSDSDNSYDSIYYFNIADDVKAGTYTITVEAEYGSKSKTELLELNVEDCSAAPYIPEEQQDEEDTVVRYVDEDGNYLTYTVFHRDSDTETSITQKPKSQVSFRETSEYAVLMIILFVLLAGAIIYAVGATIHLISRR